MENYISAYEYEQNVNPQLKSIPITTKNITDCDYGINFIDFSEIYNVKHKSTTPNLLASFIKLKEKDNIILDNYLENKDFHDTNATSHLFFIIQGNCKFLSDNESFIVSDGEIFITPNFNLLNIKNIGNNELQIYYINDSPLMNYLGGISITKIFKSCIYKKEFLLDNLHTLSNPENNRKGILLSNKDTEIIGINTITPVLWSLYNELPPNTIQNAHKHNSVALDLCISCDDSENIYTLIGDKIDENGNIMNPMKINWKQGEMFITPPGLWHSHNNTGNTFAYIIPIQDAGLLLYQRILGIVMYK